MAAGAALKAKAILIIISLLFLSVFSTWDWSFWRPGFNAFDEESRLVYSQLALEGHPRDWGLIRGGIHHLFLELVLKASGPSFAAMHGSILALMLLENLLLFLFVTSLGGTSAGAWAVAVNCLCAATLVRARSLLCFSILPCELLLFWILFLWVEGRAASFLTGLGTAVLTLDYEAWLLGAPLLFILVFLMKPRGPKKIFFVGGFALGLGLVLWLSWDQLADYWILRRAVSLRPYSGQSFVSSIWNSWSSYWLGGPALPFFSVRGHPYFRSGLSPFFSSESL
jgi:hypothetical protein